MPDAGCVCSSLFRVSQLWKGEIEGELFRGTAFRKRKRMSWVLVIEKCSSGGLKIDSVVYIQRLLVFDHNTSSSNWHGRVAESVPGSPWHCLIQGTVGEGGIEERCLILKGLVKQDGSRTVLGHSYLLLSI